MPIRWQVYPRSQKPPEVALDIAAVFDDVNAQISTASHQLKSDEVLRIVSPGLVAKGFDVERPGVRGRALRVPVLYGQNGRPIKSYEVDAWRGDIGAVIEVEAGTAFDARSFYKDLFEASAMPDARFLCMAVMNAYHPPRKKTPFDDFLRVGNVLDTLDASRGFKLDLDMVMLLGY